VSPPGLAAERRRLERGESVLVARAVAGWPWPEVVLWRLTAAAPDEVMAVYADFGAHAEWAPRVRRSRAAAGPEPGLLRVDCAPPPPRSTASLSASPPPSPTSTAP
jgi:hypothetical protein